jgi:hypothetical protein
MSTTTQELTDEQSLSAELRELESATDGEVVEGYITEIRRTMEKSYSEDSTEQIEVTVETPIDEFTQTFAKPKPPLSDWPFTRLAEEYGQGLTDVDALEGEAVPCRYDDGGEVAVPSSSLSSRFRQQELSGLTQTTTYTLAMIVGGLLLFPLWIVGVYIEVSQGEFAGFSIDNAGDLFFFLVQVTLITATWILTVPPILYTLIVA